MDVLFQYRMEAEKELCDILSYWERNALDLEQGGFYGQVASDNTPNIAADKGSVLFSRILWTFSRAYRKTSETRYLKMAERAYQYIVDRFIDSEHGGVYWTVTSRGLPANTKKQIYAQAFCIYAFSEFYRVTKTGEVLRQAIELFNLVERYSFDSERDGYLEAFTQDWRPTDEVRLSEKDQNEIKTMNTHLHLVEAYASLYLVWNEEILKKQVQGLLDIFLQHIIDHKTGHLLLFFDEKWQVSTSAISFGHDIEAAWLLQECAESIGDGDRVTLIGKYGKILAEGALHGLDIDGGLFYEKKGSLNKEKHWWVQAEAMIGFLNSYQMTGDPVYLQHSLNVWDFIKSKIKSPTGEWIWGVDEQGDQLSGHYKIGVWKCPYHNGRACMEVMERVDLLLKG